MKNNLGFSISVEGLEGAGKDTVLALMKKHLEAQGHVVEVLSDLYSTDIGMRVRDIYINATDTPPDDITTMLLITAARRTLILERILPAVREGRVVLLNRFKDSTIAIQCFAGDPRDSDNLDIETLKGKGIYMAELMSRVNSATEVTYNPNRTLLLTIDPLIQHARLGARGKLDRYDRASPKWHSLVQAGFDWCVSQDRVNRITTLDNSHLTVAELEAAVGEYLDSIPQLQM